MFRRFLQISVFQDFVVVFFIFTKNHKCVFIYLRTENLAAVNESSKNTTFRA
jgi:hypothetical protein